MKIILAALVLALTSSLAIADTTLIDTKKLPTKQVHEVAQLTPLVLDAAGKPAVVLLDVAAGDVVPPHTAKSGLRLMTVLSGDLFWGDGSVADPEKETVYPAGSVLTLPAGLDHWLAARNGPIRLQLVVLDDEKPVPGIQEQMQ